jgi:N-acetylglucosaminyldiphosphoundecaprenol N-acetyl-beta-D-mannosaminyltransferase
VTCRLLNLELDRLSWQEALAIERGVVFTPNVDHLMQVQRDEAFFRLYQAADYRLCDSRILWWASGWVDPPRLPAQLAGSDFFPAYCRQHAEGIRVFLLGGSTPAVAAEAKQRLNQQARAEMVVDAYAPPFGFEQNEPENARILARIRASGANVLAVGVGAPKQERWIMQHRNQLPEVRLFFAVGKTIDFLAGATSRAPKWMTRAGLEWAYRLLQEPGRLARRYLIEDLPVFRLLWRQKQGRYHNPWEQTS